jgi:hypothetical protein
LVAANGPVLDFAIVHQPRLLVLATLGAMILTNTEMQLPAIPSRILTERVIIETSKWLGLKKEYQDLHYTDIMNVVLKKNIWSSDIIINSRFQGQIDEQLYISVTAQESFADVNIKNMTNIAEVVISFFFVIVDRGWIYT